jgi:hypothetical protein
VDVDFVRAPPSTVRLDFDGKNRVGKMSQNARFPEKSLVRGRVALYDGRRLIAVFA